MPKESTRFSPWGWVSCGLGNRCNPLELASTHVQEGRVGWEVGATVGQWSEGVAGGSRSDGEASPRKSSGILHNIQCCFYGRFNALSILSFFYVQFSI